MPAFCRVCGPPVSCRVSTGGLVDRLGLSGYPLGPLWNALVLLGFLGGLVECLCPAEYPWRAWWKAFIWLGIRWGLCGIPGQTGDPLGVMEPLGPSGYTLGAWWERLGPIGYLLRGWWNALVPLGVPWGLGECLWSCRVPLQGFVEYLNAAG